MQATRQFYIPCPWYVLTGLDSVTVSHESIQILLSVPRPADKNPSKGYQSDLWKFLYWECKNRGLSFLPSQNA